MSSESMQARGSRPKCLPAPLRTVPPSTTPATDRGAPSQVVKYLSREVLLSTSGQRVVRNANLPNWYQYRVEFSPKEDRTHVKKRLIRAQQDVLGSGYLFDGNVLLSINRLRREPMELVVKNEERETWMKFTRAGDPIAGIHIYQSMMRKCVDGGLIEVKELKLGLSPGYLTTIRQHESSTLMYAEITHKVMRNDTAYQLMLFCREKDRDNWKSIFEKALIGSVVLTGYKDESFLVLEVDYAVNPLTEFQHRSSEKSSYKDYYRKKYNLNIYDSTQPLLVSKSNPRKIRAGMSSIVYLVPELCRLTGLTDDMRSNFQLIRALADHTRMPPNTRIDLMKLNSQLQSTASVNADLKKWQIAQSFQGRILDQEEIHFSKHIKVRAGNEADWSMRSNMGALRAWAVVYIGRLTREVHEFVRILQKSGAALNFYIPPPVFEEISDNRTATYVAALERVIATRNPQMVLCVVPNNRSDRYSAIKKKCCVDRAVPTQVVVQKNLTDKGVMLIATKTVLEISYKIGMSRNIPVPIKGLMICGYDVMKDTEKIGRSFGALVASFNSVCSRYFSAVSAQTNGEEFLQNLSINIVKAVIRYSEQNAGERPNTIVVYRAGVGEGQIPSVYKHELRIVKETLVRVYGESQPNMAFVVINRRLSRSADDCVRIPDWYDFFLVSQSVSQATVSPTSYTVIQNTTPLDPCQMQNLTYRMTHLNPNWTGTIRVPAQCQFAHDLALLAGQWLHQAPNTDRDTILF